MLVSPAPLSRPSKVVLSLVYAPASNSIAERREHHPLFKRVSGQPGTPSHETHVCIRARTYTSNMMCTHT